MSTYVPGTQERDLSKVIMSLQAVGSAGDTAAANIATNTTNIATNTTNIATNTTNIATNTTNIATNTATLTNLATPITNTLVADITMNDNLFHDGPSCAQGTSGKWFAVGTVTLVDLSGSASFVGKLWDGTTVAASCAAYSAASGVYTTITLAGYFSSPAANIRISVTDSNGVPNGRIKANASGNSKDSTLTVIRIG